MQINYIKHKRNLYDSCNICGEKHNLTWDHVPPKCITDGESVITNTAFDGLPSTTSYMRRFQSGVKYRSICERCNNVILGDYDKTYQEFTKEIERQLNSGIVLSKIITRVKINRLCRAIIGHALAAKNSYDSKNIPDKKMREYVLDQGKLLNDLHLYAWLYPYKTILIARDFVTKGYTIGTHPVDMISAVILSYPIAYMITEETVFCGIDDLGKLTTANIDDETDVVLHLETVFINRTTDYKPYNWPININDDKQTGAMFAIGGHAFHEDSRLGLKG